MGRLSAGKSTGTSDRKTSRRLMGGVGGGSAATSLEIAKIQTPSLIPRADVVDSFLQTNVPDAPGPTQIPTPPPLPGPDPNLKRLANELGSLNSNLLPFVGAAASVVGVENDVAKKEAASVIGQYGPSKNPEKVIGDISREIQADIDSGNLSTSEAKGAQKILNRLGTSGRLQRYIQSENRIANVQSNALSLAQAAEGATIESTNERGEKITLRLDSVNSEHPLYRQWLNNTIYGDQYLNPSEYSVLKPTIVNSMAQDIARQDKAHTSYRKEKLNTHILEMADSVGKNLVLAGEDGITNATQTVQKTVDRLLGLEPALTLKEEATIRDSIPTLLIQSFVKNNEKGTVSEDVLEQVLKNIMIGPEESRVINIKNKETGEIIGSKVNDKQRWYIKNGGENWLLSVLSQAKHDLAQADIKNDNANIYNGQRTASDRISTEVLPLMVGPLKDIPKALKAVTEIKKEYLAVAHKNNAPSHVISEVLKKIDAQTLGLMKTDSFTMQAEMSELSKLQVGAFTDATKMVRLSYKLDDFEKRYLGNKDAAEFANDLRAKLDLSKNTTYKSIMEGVNQRIDSIGADWKDYATRTHSYGRTGTSGTDTATEENMWTIGKVKLEQLADKAIRKRLVEGGPNMMDNIEKDLQTILTRKNANLIKKHEVTWTPDRSSLYPGSSIKAVDNLYKKYDIPRVGKLDRNTTWELIRQIQGFEPLFDPQTIQNMVKKAYGKGDGKGELNPKLKRILKITGMKAGDFFLNEVDKFNGFIELDQSTREQILSLNGIKLQ